MKSSQWNVIPFLIEFKASLPMTDFIMPGIFSIIDIAFHQGQTINIVSPNIKHENRNCKMYVEIRLGQNMTENYEYARSVIETKQGNTAEFEMHFPLISKLKIQSSHFIFKSCLFCISFVWNRAPLTKKFHSIVHGSLNQALPDSSQRNVMPFLIEFKAALSMTDFIMVGIFSFHRHVIDIALAFHYGQTMSIVTNISLAKY